VGVGQAGAGVGGGAQVVQQRPEGPAGDQHGRRVEHVLAGRALVDVAGDLGREPVGELADQRHHRVAGGPGQLAQLGRVEPVGPAVGGDRLGGLDRDQPGLGRRPGQGGLGVQHGLEEGPVADLGGHPPAAEHPAQQ
jgi:hypothetical protein